MIESQLKGDKTPDLLAFYRDIGSHENHMGRHSVEWADDRAFAEMDSSRGTRKPNKDHTSDYCQPKHPHHDLKRGDHMSIEGERVHVAVANGRQRFNAKEEGIGK